DLDRQMNIASARASEQPVRTANNRRTADNRRVFSRALLTCTERPRIDAFNRRGFGRAGNANAFSIWEGSTRRSSPHPRTVDRSTRAVWQKMALADRPQASQRHVIAA